MRPPARLVHLSEGGVNHDDARTGRQLKHAPRRSPKRRYVLIGGLLALFLLSSLSSVAGYLVYAMYTARYHSDLSLAKTGVQHLQKAQALLGTWSKKPLDAQSPGQAKQEFASALKTFTALNNDLQAVPVVAGQAPVYGQRVRTAQHLLPIAITLSQAGIAGSDALHTFIAGLRDPLASHGQGITQANVAAIARDMKTLDRALSVSARQVNQLQAADMRVEPRIARLVGSFRKNLPLLQGWLHSAEQLLPVAPALFGIGAPANYLIEILDSTELRPGGGFIGNYGVATLSGGRLSSAHITDVDLLDGPFQASGRVIPYPPAYSWFDLTPSWNLRNSNLDADFPTAARYAEQNYRREGGRVSFQGVIAITPMLVEHVLAVTGPIVVPEYNETITPQNLVARIHYHQLGPASEGSDLVPSPDGHSSLRKHFTALLAEHVLARIRQLPPAGLSRLLPMALNAVRSKDLQLYFNSDVAENLLRRLQLDSAIQAPAGDSLFVVDANISNNKSNSVITSTLADQVSIDRQGNAIHHATIRYTWPTASTVYGGPLYRDFMHVYVPPGSTLLAQSGWQPRGTSQAFHREVWMGFFTLNYGHTGTVTLTWKVPTAASKKRNCDHYQYVIQRQAGILRKLSLQVNLPTHASITNKRMGMNVQNRLAQTLDKDLEIGIDYALH